MKIGNVDFNQAHANKVTKEQFIKDHEHHANDVDLDGAYDQLQLHEEKPGKPAKADKKEVAK